LADRLALERTRLVENRGVSLGRALCSRVVWQMGMVAFLSMSFGQYAIALWLPQILRGFSGWSNFRIGVVSAIPNSVAAFAMLLVAAHSDRTGERCLHIAVASSVAAIGFLGCASVRSPVCVVVFLSVANAGVLSAHGPFWPLPSKFLSGEAAAGGIALISSLSNLSGFVGPYMIGLLDTAGSQFRTGFLVLAFMVLAGMVLALRLRRAAVLKFVK
jgi:MFS transporter, ACS family, tartrate transporter